MESLLSKLKPEQRGIFDAVRRHAETALDYAPRFKYFTLHGSAHIATMLDVAGLMVRGGVNLSSDEAYFLALAICLHDTGMVVGLHNADETDVFQGMPQSPDPATTEAFIREHHHDLIEKYLGEQAGFLTSLGVAPADIALVRDISRGHRVVDLRKQQGAARRLGALLRLIDEFDLSPRRAPIAILRTHHAEMGATATWHWFKHNIVEPWRENHTVTFITEGSNRRIQFHLAIHAPAYNSQDYWQTQIRRPINKALHDEGCAREIRDAWGIQIACDVSAELSTPIPLDEQWSAIEQMALSGKRKVVLVIDDENRKMVDLFQPLMDTYHVVFAYSASDGLTKLSVTHVDLAIVDMQLGSGQIWTAEETQNFKVTGLKLIEEIHRRFPETRVGVLTGTRYDIGQPPEGLEFFLRKPVHPEYLENRVRHVLG